MDDVVCEGYLVKSPPLNQKHSSWCRRYFTLHNQDYVLRYQKRAKSRNMIGEIDLTSIHKINESSPHASEYKYEFGFELESAERVWVLVADCEEDMKKWLSCLSSTVEESKKSGVGSPRPPTKRKDSVVKKAGRYVGKRLAKPRSQTIGEIQELSESSSTSQLRRDSSYCSLEGEIRGDDSSQFDIEDDSVDQQSIHHSKSVSSHMSFDSAISSGHSSRVRLTDGLPVAEPILDEESQRKWMLKMNQSVSAAESVAPISYNSTMPSAVLIRTGPLSSPTLGRGETMSGSISIDGVEIQNQYEADEPITPTLKEDRTATLRQRDSKPTRQIETITNNSYDTAEDLYDIPNNVIRAIESLPDDIYDIPHAKSTPSPVADKRTADTRRPHRTSLVADEIYDTPAPRRLTEPKYIYDTPPAKSFQASPDPDESQTTSHRASLIAEEIYDTPKPRRLAESEYPYDIPPGPKPNRKHSTGFPEIPKPKPRGTRSQSSVESAYELISIADNDKDDRRTSSSNVETDGGFSTPEFATRTSGDFSVYSSAFDVHQLQGELQPTEIKPKPVTPPKPSSVSSPSIPGRSPIRRATNESPVTPDRASTPPVRPVPNRPVPAQPSPGTSPQFNFPDTKSNTMKSSRPSNNGSPNLMMGRAATMKPSRAVPVRPAAAVPSLPPRTAVAPPIPSRITPILPENRRSDPLVELCTEGNKPVGSRTLTRSKMENRDSSHLHRPKPAPLNNYTDMKPGQMSASEKTTYNQTRDTPNPRQTDPVNNTTNPFLPGYADTSQCSTLPGRSPAVTAPARTPLAVNVPPGPLFLSDLAQVEFNSIPDSPPTPEGRKAVPQPTLIPNPANPKYPTIRTTGVGMVRIKPAYQNVADVKGALDRGSAVKGSSHTKLNKRTKGPDQGYTPMRSMEERQQQATTARAVAAPPPKLHPGYEPMGSHESRMKNHQLNLSNPARTCIQLQAPSPVYVAADACLTELTEYTSMNDQFAGMVDPAQVEYLPMCSEGNDDFLSVGTMATGQDGYLAMSPRSCLEGYLAMSPRIGQEGYLAMAPGGPQEDYLAMAPGGPQEDYLAMAPGGPQEDYLAMAPGSDVIQGGYTPMDLDQDGALAGLNFE